MAGPGDIIEGGANLLAIPFAELAAAGSQSEADAYQRAALAKLLGLNPDELAVTAEQAGPSAFRSVQEDPRLRQAQMSALSRLQSIVDAGGMDPQSMDALMQSQSLVEQQNRGAQEALRSQAARRGISGSGLEMARAMEGQQAAAARLNAAGTKAAADARTRALQAMQMQSAMAGDVRNDDYRRAADAAAAADAIEKFNATNRQGAGQFNSNMRQNVAETQSGALAGSAGYYQDKADATRRRVGGAFKGAGKVANGAVTTGMGG